MIRFLMAVAAVLLAVCGAKAQVTSEPTPLMDNSPDVTIFFHADQGNRGLAGLPASTQIYAHTGVITNNSSSDTDWEFAPQWGDNAAKYRLEYVSPDLWKLHIGDIRTYYGITDPAIEVKKLAFVFRTADKSKTGKGDGDRDIFINVYQSGAHIELISSLPGSFAVAGEEVTVTANATVSGKIEIYNFEEMVKSAGNVSSLTYTFPADSRPEGWSFRAVLTAPEGETCQSEILRIVSLIPSERKDYPGGTPRPGAVRDGDTMLFCLPAPGKESVTLVGSWDDFNLTGTQMYFHDYEGQRYFWTEVKGLSPQSIYTYYYYVDGRYRVGDPYARLVLDPWNDKYIPESVFPGLPEYPYNYVQDVCLAVLMPEDNGYVWKFGDFHGPEPSDLRIYEMLLRDFTGSEGEALGNGTVRGAIDMIPYIRNLGVNAVELLPINEFNGNISWGYNPNFYFAPDKAYGTPDDYKEFIDKCHEAGLAVILDMVFNQSDWQHPWYRMYEEGSNPMYNVTAPHAYSVLNDWNQDHPLVQKQWDDVLTYWLTEYKVDGFRFDLVKGLGDNNSYPNAGDSGTDAFNQSRIDRMRRLQQVIEKVKPGAYFINENLAGAQEENAMAAYGQLNWANLNNAGCQYAMGYPSGSGLDRMYAPDDNRTWGSTVSYLESHDEQRLAYKQNQWGATGVKGDLGKSMLRLGACAAQMIMSPGAHLIWMFSELGNDQNTKSASGENNTDPKTVCWSLLDQPERAGLAETYSRLHRIRKSFPELFSRSASFESKCSASDWTNGRVMISRAADQEIYTVLNPSVSGTAAIKVDFTYKDNSRYKMMLNGYGTESTFDAVTGIVNVPANSFVVIGTAEMAGVTDLTDEDSGEDQISVCKDGIVISSDHTVSVYTLSGARIALSDSRGRREIPLPSGMYVVRYGGKAVKVLIR